MGKSFLQRCAVLEGGVSVTEGLLSDTSLALHGSGLNPLGNVSHPHYTPEYCLSYLNFNPLMDV